jgi:hypothetical protein
MQAMRMIGFRIGVLTTLFILTGAFITTAARAEIFYYQLQLSGGQAGDADGEAHGTLSIDSETGNIIWGLYYSNIEAPTAMHIHRGAAGAGGGVIVPLNVESKLGAGALTGTVTAEADAVAEILGGAETFYLNIHTADYPRGVLRAQLGTEWSAQN